MRSSLLPEKVEQDVPASVGKIREHGKDEYGEGLKELVLRSRSDDRYPTRNPGPERGEDKERGVWSDDKEKRDAKVDHDAYRDEEISEPSRPTERRKDIVMLRRAEEHADALACVHIDKTDKRRKEENIP